MYTLKGYVCFEIIHEGHRNIVYSAKRLDDEMPVILKTLRSEKPALVEIARVYHEFEVTRDLALPGVIKTYALIDEQNQFALVQEDMQGISLRDYVKIEQIKDLSVFYNIALQMVKIIGEIHRHHIIHKDIKPGNFIVDPKSLSVKLTDFNFAAKLQHESQDIVTPEKLEGTLPYMAPEQTGRMNISIDYRSDFYALGVSFYELLTGELPYKFTDPLELIHAHLTLPAPDASEIKPEIPKSLAKIIQKMMAIDPSNRYQSTIGIMFDLERCMNGESDPFVLGNGDVCDRLNLSQKLYGREREVEVLLDTYNRVSQGSVEALMVCGYSGIGKTKLINEVHKPMVKQRGYFISGKFDQLERNTPYTAFKQAFNQLAKLMISESEERFQAHRQKIISAMGSVAQIIIDIAPDFELVIGPQPILEQLPPQETQNRMMIFFKRFLCSIASKDHPLVIFIDDLQWIDSGSLNIFEYILNNDELNHVLLIGAYRDNEVDEQHPLVQFFKGIQAEKKSIQMLPLGPLTPNHFASLYADSFNRSQEITKPLADHIHKRTQGNPFFCKQVTNLLYSQNILHFDYEHHCWDWDLEKIKALKITDNVVEFMLAKLHELPSETLSLLKYAACIGNRFTVEMLVLVTGLSPDNIGKVLWPAMQEELIISLQLGYKRMDAMSHESLSALLSKDITYQFIHDRVQQAVYDCISQDEKEKIHLTIARLLIEKEPDACKKERLFEVTDHFNQAHDLLTDTEKMDVIHLNYEAGRRAQNSNAYEPMLKYVREGLALTNSRGWESYYDLMFDLNFLYAQSLYLTGAIADSEKFSENLLHYAKKPTDKARIFRLRCVHMLVTGNNDQALEAGLTALSFLGIKIPKYPSKISMLIKIYQLKLLLIKHKIEELERELQPLTNVQIITAFEIMNEITIPAYQITGNILPYLYVTGMLLMLRHGRPSSMEVWITGYALVLLIGFKDLKNSLALSNIAERLTSQQTDKYSSSVSLMTRTMFLSHLCRPFKEAIPYFEKAKRDAQESGNLINAGTCAFLIWESMEKESKSLKESREYGEYVINFCRKNHVEDIVEGTVFFIALRDVQMGLIPPSELQWKLFQEFTIKNPFFELLGPKAMSIHLFFLESYEPASECHFRWYIHEEKVHYTTGTFSDLTIDALSLAKCIPNLSFLQKMRYRNRFRIIHRDIKWAAKQCPHNYLHQYLILSGVKAQLAGRFDEAIRDFESASKSALKGDFYLWVGIANELIGELCLKQDFHGALQFYVREAHYYYNRYGLVLKVKALEKRYPECFAIHKVKNREEGESESSSSITTSSTNLDFTSIIKASQSISSEIVLEKLFEKMLHITIENAGAQKAVFIEKQKNKWLVTASLLHITDPEQFQMLNIPLKEFDEIPHTLLNTSLRSKEPLIVDNPKEDSHFSGDNYIISASPKSVMCLPIVHHDTLFALIYLENKLTAGAFTEERITVLRTLSAQIAISLENARYFEQTEILYRATERFVPKPFLKLLHKEHIEEVTLGDSTEVEVTVMFTDIRGYTTITEKQSPQEAFSFINAYLKVMAPIIRAHQGFINQYQGDAIMALFPRSADDGVKAVKAMAESLTKYNLEQAKSNRPQLKVGYGLNTGKAMLGTIGEEERMDANVISDAINLGSRVESLNKFYGTRFLISDGTLNALTDKTQVITRLVDKVQVKGKSNVVYLYEVYFQGSVDANERKFIDTYEAAFKDYEKGNFAKALAQFKECQQQKPSDESVAVFVERCETLVKHPIPEGWNGTYEMTHK